MRPLILTLIVVLFSTTSHAQRWTELNPPKSLFGNTIFATVADSSGKIYAAGSGTDSAGDYCVAVLENGSWKELGVNTGKLHAKGNIYGLTLDPSGNLYAAGMFYDESGRIYVAKWNGNSWSETGPATSAQNFTGLVFALTADNQGNIYAAGEMIDSLGYYYVSKFDGTQWQPLGKGFQSLHANGIMYTVAADAQGNVYAAGQFTNASGKYYVAKWDGNSWSELGTGAAALNANGSISQIQIDASGNVYVCGYFKNVDGYSYVAKWNGSGWSELDTGVSALQAKEAITAMHIDKNDHLFVGCQVADDSTGARFISQWTGNGWTKIEATPGFYFNNYILTITSDLNGNLYTAGNFTDSWNEQFVAKYSAGVWSHPGDIGGRMPEQSNHMKSMATDTGGHIFAVLGNYYSTEQTDVVRWNGKGWDALPAFDSAGYYNIVLSLAGDSLGNMYAMGNFHGTGLLGKWNGTNWTPIFFNNGITSSFLNAIATDKKGDVYLAGTFIQNGTLTGIAKWDGNNWSLFANTDIIRMIVDPNSGSIYTAVLDFPNFGYNIRKFDGSIVTDIGATPSQPFGVNATNWMSSLALDAQGNLYAAGSLRDSSGNPFVAKWDGTNWSHLENDTSKFNASGQINSIAFDKNGDLIAGGSLMKYSGTYIGEWNGRSWQAVGDNTEFWGQQNLGYMARDGRGNIYAEVSNNIFRYTGDQSNSASPPCLDSQYQIHMTISKNTVSGTSTSADILASGMPQDTSVSYSIEFSDDRNFIHRLQSTNNNNKLTLEAVDLLPGKNNFYGRMMTIDLCGNQSTTTDSVSIIKTADGGLLDADFPNTPILSYPNPVDNEIHVGGLSATKTYIIEVYNNQGNKVSQLTISDNTDAYLDAHSLAPGVYMVQIYDNTKGRLIGVLRIVKGSN